MEMVARKWSAPILKHLLEAAFGEMRPHQVLRDVGQAESRQRRVKHLGCRRKDELTFDVHFKLPFTFFKLPGLQPAIGGQAQIDVVVWRYAIKIMIEGSRRDCQITPW